MIGFPKATEPITPSSDHKHSLVIPTFVVCPPKTSGGEKNTHAALPRDPQVSIKQLHDQFQEQFFTVTPGSRKVDVIWRGIKEGAENQYCRRHKACSVDSSEGVRIHLAQLCRQLRVHPRPTQPLSNTPCIFWPRTPTNHVNQYWLIAYLIICDM